MNCPGQSPAQRQGSLGLHSSSTRQYFMLQPGLAWPAFITSPVSSQCNPLYFRSGRFLSLRIFQLFWTNLEPQSCWTPAFSAPSRYSQQNTRVLYDPTLLLLFFDKTLNIVFIIKYLLNKYEMPVLWLFLYT